MAKYKYIHILGVDEINYSYRIVNFFNSSIDSLPTGKHYFVTPFDRVYERIKDFPNVLPCEHFSNSNYKIINYYCKVSENVFLHGLPAFKDLLFLESENCRKIIWRTWGHDFHIVKWTWNMSMKNYGKWFLQYIVLRKIRKFKMIGISNIVDRLSLNNGLKGKVQYHVMPYPSNIVLNFSFDTKKQKEVTSILLGHSGHSNDNHIEVLKKLENYRKENIKLYIPLSYGDKAYIDEVTHYLENNWKEQFVILKELIPYTDFFELLKKIDVAILDGKKSYALGNLFLLVNLRKKIFLNEEGLLFEAFCNINLPCFSTNIIGNISFDKFASDVIYPANIPSDFKYKNHDEYVADWIDILKTIN